MKIDRLVSSACLGHLECPCLGAGLLGAKPDCLMSAFLRLFVRKGEIKWWSHSCCDVSAAIASPGWALQQLPRKDGSKGWGKGLIKYWREGSLFLVFPGRSRTRTVVGLRFFPRYMGKSEQGFFIYLLCNLLGWIYDTLFSEVGNWMKHWMEGWEITNNCFSFGCWERWLLMHAPLIAL